MQRRKPAMITMTIRQAKSEKVVSAEKLGFLYESKYSSSSGGSSSMDAVYQWDWRRLNKNLIRL